MEKIYKYKDSHTYSFNYNCTSICNQINKLTIKIYSSLSNVKIHYYLKHRIPQLHRQFFKILSQNQDYVQTHCNERNSPFHFACGKWFNQLN